MIDWSPGPPLDGDTAPRIGVDGMVDSGDVNSDFRATSFAMASHDLRQPAADDHRRSAVGRGSCFAVVV